MRARTHTHLNKQCTAIAYHILLKGNFSCFQNQKLPDCKLPPSADSYLSASLAALVFFFSVFWFGVSFDSLLRSGIKQSVNSLPIFRKPFPSQTLETN